MISILVSNTKRELQQMLDVVTKIGIKLQIKFNPDKTNYLSINEHRKINNRMYLNDDITLKMDGMVIENVKSFRYLGNQISSDVKNVLHVDNRIAKATRISQTIKKLGFLKTPEIETLAQLHKSYIRPILYYGLDSLFLSRDDRDRIRTYESNNIKLGLRLPPRLKTKKLLDALRIDDFTHRIKLMKLNLFTRIMKNDYTKKFFKALVHEYNRNIHKKTLLYELVSELRPNVNYNELGTRCEMLQQAMKRAFKEYTNKNKEVKQLRTLLADVERNKDQICSSLLAF